MGFGEQLKYYTKTMRTTQRHLAGLINESEQTLGNWARGVNMSGEQLERLSDVTGASMDWWRGRRVVTMWGAEVLELRDALAEEAPRIEALDVVERCAKVIQFMQRTSKLCSQDWFMAGICNLSQSDFRKLITELPEDISPLTVQRLADFTHLHPYWLMDGDTSAQQYKPNLGDLAAIVRQMRDDGLTREEIVGNYALFRNVIEQQRRIKAAAGEH